MRACLSNAYQALDVIHHQLVELLGSPDFHHCEYVAGAPTRVGHLDSRQSCDLPSNVARPARLRGNDDIGSHDRPSKGPRFRQQYTNQATLSTDKSHYRKRTHYPKSWELFLHPPRTLL